MQEQQFHSLVSSSPRAFSATVHLAVAKLHVDPNVCSSSSPQWIFECRILPDTFLQQSTSLLQHGMCVCLLQSSVVFFLFSFFLSFYRSLPGHFPVTMVKVHFFFSLLSLWKDQTWRPPVRTLRIRGDGRRRCCLNQDSEPTPLHSRDQHHHHPAHIPPSSINKTDKYINHHKTPSCLTETGFF